MGVPGVGRQGRLGDGERVSRSHHIRGGRGPRTRTPHTPRSTPDVRTDGGRVSFWKEIGWVDRGLHGPVRTTYRLVLLPPAQGPHDQTPFRLRTYRGRVHGEGPTPVGLGTSTVSDRNGSQSQKEEGKSEPLQTSRVDSSTVTRPRRKPRSPDR